MSEEQAGLSQSGVETAEVSKEELMLATEVMQSFVKASKGFKMYLPNNPLLRKFNDDLKSSMGRQLSLHGEYRLEIDQFELRYKGKVVYDNNDPKESMAFKMYSDGIRFLTFSEGMEDYELLDLLEVIAKDRPSDVDDDIVTLLWEKNLPNVNYILAEDFLEFDSAGAGPPVQQSQQEKIKGIYQSISSSHAPPAAPMLVPQKILSLTDEEAEWLQTAKQAEETRKPLDEVVQILTSILVGEKDPEMFNDFLGIMARLTEDLAAAGEIKYTISLVRFMANLAANEKTPPAAREAILQALGTVFSERTIKELVRVVDGTDVITPEELLELLQLFGKPCLRKICDFLSLVQKMKMRKAVIQTLIEIGHDTPEVFISQLSDQRWYVVRNMIFILNRIGSGGALEHVVGLISHKEPAVRREVLNYLERHPDGKARTYLLKFLRDEASAVRVRALQVLVSSRSKFALKPIMAIAASEQFAEKELSEKKAVYEAIGELGAGEMMPMFRDMLMKKYWFNKVKEKEAVTCAVAGLMKIGGQEAVKLLEDYSSTKNDELRGIIIRAIEALTTDTSKKTTGA